MESGRYIPVAGSPPTQNDWEELGPGSRFVTTHDPWVTKSSGTRDRKMSAGPSKDLAISRPKG